MSKQSSVDFILNAFNLLSDSDFKAWMLNNYDEVKAMHKEEIEEAHYDGSIITLLKPNDDMLKQSEQYYKETFGNEEVL